MSQPRVIVPHSPFFWRDYANLYYVTHCPSVFIPNTDRLEDIIRRYFALYEELGEWQTAREPSADEEFVPSEEIDFSVTAKAIFDEKEQVAGYLECNAEGDNEVRLQVRMRFNRDEDLHFCAARMPNGQELNAHEFNTFASERAALEGCVNEFDVNFIHQLLQMFRDEMKRFDACIEVPLPRVIDGTVRPTPIPDEEERAVVTVTDERKDEDVAYFQEDCDRLFMDHRELMVDAVREGVRRQYTVPEIIEWVKTQWREVLVSSQIPGYCTPTRQTLVDYVRQTLNQLEGVIVR